MPTLHGAEVLILSKPRRIPGGEVVTITWAKDSTLPQHILSDGSVHPVHRHGFKWEEPVYNLVGK